MYFIYTLSDPRDSQIRYVGISRDVNRRYAMHLLNPGRTSTSKDKWIRELREAGLAPIVNAIETTEKREEAEEREFYWIRHFLQSEAQLTNISKTGYAEPHQKMEENDVQNFILSLGWTPQIKQRRNGKLYLYAARWNNPKTEWRYIGAISRLGEMTEEKIIAKINK